MEQLKALKKYIPSLDEICTQIENSQVYYFLAERYYSLTNLHKRIFRNSFVLVFCFLAFLTVSWIYSFKSKSRDSALDKLYSLNLIDNYHRENIDNAHKIRQLKYVEIRQRFGTHEQMFAELSAGLNIEPKNIKIESQTLKSNSAFEKIVLQVNLSNINIEQFLQLIHRVESIGGNLFVHELKINKESPDSVSFNVFLGIAYYEKSLEMN